MLLRFFRLSILAFEVGERHIQRFVTKPDSDGLVETPRPTVAVGTTIADRPPHRSVRARLRIRLLPRMNGVEALVRIRMQNMRVRNPPVQRDRLIPLVSPLLANVYLHYVFDLWVDHCSLGSTHLRCRPLAIFRYSGL
jgi:hypothetical protein